jgi:phosphoribosylamine--glycine ligase
LHRGPGEQEDEQEEARAEHSRRLLGRLGGAGREDGLPKRAQVLDRSGDIAGVDIRALLVAVSDLPRRLVRRLELRVLRSHRLVAHLDAEKLFDLVARFDERIGRILGESLLELRPASLPFVQVEPWVSHTHALLMRGAATRQTRAVDSAAVKVLLVGSGGREHALAWKLAQAPGLESLHAAPGNPGIARLGDCHPVRAEDGESLLGLARSLGIDLVVIGPEAPLVAGVADLLRRNGVAVFGPGRAAARIEGSKSFAKSVLAAAAVPTAETLAVARPPCVVKVDGLAAGKGVFVCETVEQLDEGLRAAANFPGPIVIEELLVGEEVSVFALADGRAVVPLAPAQDFKRIGEGDTGPNTGGMGSFSPVPGMGAGEVAELVEQIHKPVVEELARRGAPFVGVLFAGLMVTPEGPKVLEFNCRFGDPETQSILPRLEGDFLGALAAAAGGDLEGVELTASDDAAVTVVLAGAHYPESSDSGSVIEGIEDAEAAGALVFHAGTALHGDRLVTNGGRILGVTGTGATIGEARDRAYAGCELISFAGARYRTDIALTASGKHG